MVMVWNDRMETQSALVFTLAHHSRFHGEPLSAGLILIGQGQLAIENNRTANGRKAMRTRSCRLHTGTKFVRFLWLSPCTESQP